MVPRGVRPSSTCRRPEIAILSRKAGARCSGHEVQDRHRPVSPPPGIRDRHRPRSTGQAPTSKYRTGTDLSRRPRSTGQALTCLASSSCWSTPRPASAEPETRPRQRPPELHVPGPPDGPEGRTPLFNLSTPRDRNTQPEGWGPLFGTRSSGQAPTCLAGQAPTCLAPAKPSTAHDGLWKLGILGRLQPQARLPWVPVRSTAIRWIHPRIGPMTPGLSPLLIPPTLAATSGTLHICA